MNIVKAFVRSCALFVGINICFYTNADYQLSFRQQYWALMIAAFPFAYIPLVIDQYKEYTDLRKKLGNVPDAQKKDIKERIHIHVFKSIMSLPMIFVILYCIERSHFIGERLMKKVIDIIV